MAGENHQAFLYVAAAVGVFMTAIGIFIEPMRIVARYEDATWRELRKLIGMSAVAFLIGAAIGYLIAAWGGWAEPDLGSILLVTWLSALVVLVCFLGFWESIWMRGRAVARPSKDPRGGALALVGRIGSIGAKIIGLTKGVFWLLVALALALMAFAAFMEWNGRFEAREAIHIIWLCVCGAGAFVFLVRGCNEIAPVLRVPATLENQNVHGAARIATEEETQRAARGATRISPVHDQNFPD